MEQNGIPQVPAQPTTLSQPPPASNNTQQPTPSQNKKSAMIIGIVIGLIIVGSIILIVNGARNNSVLTLPAQKENLSAAAATPTPIVTDTAPSVPTNQKAQIIIHHSDSSFETFLVPNTNITLFKKSLQPGDTIFQIIPPKQ